MGTYVKMTYIWRLSKYSDKLKILDIITDNYKIDYMGFLKFYNGLKAE
jgi:hypothetical protein